MKVANEVNFQELFFEVSPLAHKLHHVLKTFFSFSDLFPKFTILN